MNPNSYRLPDANEVDAADIAALLDELRDVGGAVADPTSSSSGRGGGNRPLSSKTVRRGVVGGTSILTEQQRSGTTVPSLGQHRRTSGSAESHPATTGPSGGTLAPIGFSTYDAAEAARMDAQLLQQQQQQQQQQLATTPLGVRLTPLAQQSTPSPAARTLTSPVLPPTSPSKRPHPPPPRLPESPSAAPAARVGGAQRPSLNSQSALPPLPSLPQRPGIGSGWTAEGKNFNVKSVNTPAQTSSGDFAVAGEHDSSSGSAPREINFLPIMCARYLRPVGLTPTARWGHTLTPITPDTLLLFGGLDVNGTETASLMSFNPTTISWEPLYSMSDAPVARHSHAACAYDGRYLVISGGVAQHGGRVLDDVHLYDTYTHQWRCVWSGERDGSPQNRNEPGPRFGHSVVLHEDRLYLYGGKTVGQVAAADASEKRRGSITTTSPSKTGRNGLPAPLSSAASAAAATTAAAVLASGSDVYVFSLNSFRWRRRLHNAKVRRSSSTSAAAAAAAAGDAQEAVDGEPTTPARPAARAHHAACVRGTTLFINGGAGSGDVLTDTWSLELTTGVWRCVHRGGTADAVPREKHALFVCGEALLLVGGCSGAGGLNERITGKFTNFAVVLPLVGAAVDTPCWIPVAMGNLSIVSPSKKSFGAALSGGFVYVFGGVCGAEPATNSMVRFLAADGCISQNDQTVQLSGGGGVGSAATGTQQLRWMLQQLREQQRGTPFDAYAYAGTYGSVSDIAATIAQLPPTWAGAPSDETPPAGSAAANVSDASAGRADNAIVGLHRAIVQQRAPLFWEELAKCRSDAYRVGSNVRGLNGTPQRRRESENASSGGGPNGNHSTDGFDDEVDVLLREVGGANDNNGGGGGGGATPQKADNHDNRSRTVSEVGSEGLPVYYTNGTTRIPGLLQPLTADALQCLVDYVYWGGLKGKYRVLLEEEKDETEEGGNNNVGGSGGGGASFSAEYRQQLTQTLEKVKAVAQVYQLDPLVQLCAGLLAGNRDAIREARQRSSEQLREDLAALLSSPATANTTMLVVDPHTTAKAAHVLHASVLMAASGLFTDLLRPLYRASAGLGNSKAANQVGPLAAKLSTAAAQSPTTLLTSSSKRTVLIGPVPLPLPAVRPILRYLYTQELQVSGELAFEVMLGAHQLGLTELQALCEAVVAREEVNYQTCCTFYYLSRKYQASLLEEIALLTAVSGFAEVRYTAAYQSLSDEEKQNIDAVAAELGSSTWVPPPQPTQEIKSKAAYAARWDSSSPM